MGDVVVFEVYRRSPKFYAVSREALRLGLDRRPKGYTLDAVVRATSSDEAEGYIFAKVLARPPRGTEELPEVVDLTKKKGRVRHG
jgi:hypothetical protein